MSRISDQAAIAAASRVAVTDSLAGERAARSRCPRHFEAVGEPQAGGLDPRTIRPLAMEGEAVPGARPILIQLEPAAVNTLKLFVVTMLTQILQQECD